MVTDSLSDPVQIINTFIEHLEALEAHLCKAKALASVMLSHDFIEETPKNLMYEYFGILCDVLCQAEQCNEIKLEHWMKMKQDFKSSRNAGAAAMPPGNTPCGCR